MNELKKTVEFPIFRNVVTMGNEVRKVLYEGDTVRCPRCGYIFAADRNTVFRAGDMEYLSCPRLIRTEEDDDGVITHVRCNYQFAVLYAVHDEITETQEE